MFKFLRTLFNSVPPTQHELAARDAFAKLYPKRRFLRVVLAADEDARFVYRLFYSGGKPSPYAIFFVDKANLAATELNPKKARGSKYGIRGYR